MATIRIGVSGWSYPGWRGVFYPRGLPRRHELAYLLDRMSTVEINASFYSLQRPSSWSTWASRVPEGGTLAVKGSRFLTHMKRLRDVADPLGTFLASGPCLLGDRLGPFLWQLPARTVFDADRLRAFVELLPRTEADASRLARSAPDLVRARTGERSWQRAGVADRPLRHALEVRHPSFVDPAFADLCREHGIAVVVSDAGDRWPMLTEVTADHVYVRLHGATELYASGYDSAAIEAWADRVRGWAERTDVRQVLVYFDNDAKVHAPRDAIALAEVLGVGPTAGVDATAVPPRHTPGHRVLGSSPEPAAPRWRDHADHSPA